MNRSTLVFVLAVCLGCSPLVRVHVEFALPGGKTLDPMHLFLRGRVLCNPVGASSSGLQPFAAPEPGLSESVLPVPRDQPAPFDMIRDGTTYDTQFRASKCLIAITAFYDTNHDDIVDAGDYVAKLPATEVRDRGLCQGNKNDLGTLTLQRMP